MREIKLSSELPAEAVSYVFDEVNAKLERRDYPSHVSVMPSMRVITVNNDDKFFGVLLQRVESAVEAWIQENRDELSDSEISELQASNTVVTHSV